MSIGDRIPHSLKPYLLDGLLSWCAANRLTPVLAVNPDPNRLVPEHAKEKEGGMAFNVSSKAVLEKNISTEGLTFVTYFKNKNDPERVFLPISCWKHIRIKETNQQFDLSFQESLEHQFLRWPNGISLSTPQDVAQFEKHDDQLASIISGNRKKGQLSLVWDRKKAEIQR